MENILKALESEDSKEKIKILEMLVDNDNPEILEKIISNLNDDDIQVRGEAFSSLILNKNKITDYLIRSLRSQSKNIRGFASLVLANRNETFAIPEIMKLANDESGMVRSCAIGALGHLRAQQAKQVFLNSLSDSNIEVRKSALQSIIDLDIKIDSEKIKEINAENDAEIEKLLLKIMK
ncbi:MAG: HEAT repeat domain-containing protein [Nitrosopumilus sp.]|nr:HEAT repeat domain-containing protein [Nitrosopumilus sp.]NNL58722.1 HEAT repeat domain-containing protein [Nitrosopumilus sp.]